MGKVRILYGAGTISLQAAVHPKCTLGALDMKEEEEDIFRKKNVINVCEVAFVLEM